jgi:hypothetical protein
MHVLRFDACRVHAGHLRFERKYASCALGRLVEAGELEHGLDMRLI